MSCILVYDIMPFQMLIIAKNINEYMGDFISVPSDRLPFVLLLLKYNK